MVVVSEANMNDGWATIFRTKRTSNIIGVCWSDAQSMLYKAVRFVPETSRGRDRGVIALLHLSKTGQSLEVIWVDRRLYRRVV